MLPALTATGMSTYTFAPLVMSVCPISLVVAGSTVLLSSTSLLPSAGAAIVPFSLSRCTLRASAGFGTIDISVCVLLAASLAEEAITIGPWLLNSCTNFLNISTFGSTMYRVELEGHPFRMLLAIP